MLNFGWKSARKQRPGNPAATKKLILSFLHYSCKYTFKIYWYRGQTWWWEDMTFMLERQKQHLTIKHSEIIVFVKEHNIFHIFAPMCKCFICRQKLEYLEYLPFHLLWRNSLNGLMQKEVSFILHFGIFMLLSEWFYFSFSGGNLPVVLHLFWHLAKFGSRASNAKWHKMMSSISSLVRIWKIWHHGHGCKFVLIFMSDIFSIKTLMYIEWVSLPGLLHNVGTKTCQDSHIEDTQHGRRLGNCDTAIVCHHNWQHLYHRYIDILRQ